MELGFGHPASWLPLLVQSPGARDESREDKTTIKCETSPPSSPRTLRLEKLGHPALSQEDGKRYVEHLWLSHQWLLWWFGDLCGAVGWSAVCHGLCASQE